MKAETRTLRSILQGDRRFVVPVYQRPYVWERERQWEPLWNDVESTALRLADVRIAGHLSEAGQAEADKSAAPHFLGAIVLEQHPTATGDVDVRLVVDGQQRLITLQLLVRGVIDAIEEAGLKGAPAAKLRKLILNDEDVVPTADLQKVAPRPSEEAEYKGAMEPRPSSQTTSQFAAARSFFYEAAFGFLRDSDVPQDPYGVGNGLERRASLLVASLVDLIKLVVIDLEDVDDAQIIFEALNARNTPLSATDLVKNLLFMRAQKEGHDPRHLYEKIWSRFDDEDDWWREPVGIGHAQRARQDWLLGDWLIAQLGRVINVGRLYGEFRRWLEDSKTEPVKALETLGTYADGYEKLHGRIEGVSKKERTAYERIEALNITAATPILLWLLSQPGEVLHPREREVAFQAIESFVVRRMAAKWQTRAYSQVFAEVLREVMAAPSDAGRAVVAALASDPHGYAWPTDDDLVQQFKASRYYGPGGISQARLRLLLGAVDETMQAEVHKGEVVDLDYESLQVEHIIPQNWEEHWPITARTIMSDWCSVNKDNPMSIV